MRNWLYPDDWVEMCLTVVVQQSQRAFQVRTELADGKSFWLPKSQVAEAEDLTPGQRNLIVHVRRWFLERLELP